MAVKKRSLIKAIYGNINHDRNRATKDHKPQSAARPKNKVRSPLKRFFSQGTPVTAVCVRTCDGYHFPVNFSGRQDNFENASGICRTMCPGAKMDLFLRESSKKSTNHLYSATTGKPYAALPNAFVFQKNFNPNCSCNYRLLNKQAKAKQTAPIETLDQLEQNVSTARMPIPMARVDRGQDPETVANLAGGWSIKTVQELKHAYIKPESANTEPKKVRIVGDRYFPGQ